MTSLNVHVKIHRVKFSGAKTIIFQLGKMESEYISTLLDIDHVYCDEGKLCQIEVCHLSDCALIKQALDPKDKSRILMSNSTENYTMVPIEATQDLASKSMDGLTKGITVPNDNFFSSWFTTKSILQESTRSKSTVSSHIHSKGTRCAILDKTLLVFTVLLCSCTLRIVI